MNVLMKSIILVNLVVLICIDHVRSVAKIARTLGQDGFHRDLETEISFSELNDQIIKNSCKLLVIENLPSGVYVDPYQISSVERDYQVFIKDEVDIEAPEYLSSSLQVLIYRNVTSSTIHISLPIHIRYHRPSNISQYTEISILPPTIYTDCSGLNKNTAEMFQAPCENTKSDICNWKPLKFSEDIETLKLLVPVGQVADELLVTVATLVITATGCLLLIYKLLVTTVTDKKKEK